MWAVAFYSLRFNKVERGGILVWPCLSVCPSVERIVSAVYLPLGWRALKTPTAETPGFYGHVTTLTLQYLWPRPPGVWLGGPGCKPGHSGWSWWSPTITIASGLIPVMNSLDPFHSCTSYQATSEGVSHVKLLLKFQNLTLSCLTWDMI